MKKIFIEKTKWLSSLNKYDLVVFLLIIFFVCSSLFVVHAKVDGYLLRSGDTADAEQALWNASHGNGFMQGDLLDQSDFREHLNFVQFLYLPFYKIVPNLYTLYFIITLSYAAAAWALFVYAKSRIDEMSALVLSLIFLLNPIVLTSNMDAMHVVSVAGPFLLFVLIFYEKKQYSWWFFWLLITASVSEFVAPTIIMLGVLAALQRRSLKWILPPVFAGTAMFAAAHFYITLGYAQNARLKDILFGSDMLGNLSGKRLHIVKDFFKPFFYFLPFFSSYTLLILPTLAIVFYAIDKSRLGTSPHLFVFVPTILIFAMVDILSRAGQKMRKLILLAVAIGTILSVDMWNGLLSIKPDNNAATMEKAVSIIPQSASVSSFRIIAPHVNHRKYFYFLDNQQYTDFVLLNTNTSDTTNKAWASYLDSVENSGDYLKIFDEKPVSVYISKTEAANLLGKDIGEVSEANVSEITKLLK